MAQTFEQYLASSGQQSTADQLRKTGQFGQAEADYNAGKSPYASNPSTGSNSGNFQDSVQQAIEMNRKANEPAIQSLQASLPEVTQRFEQQRQQTSAQIEPLKQRYDQLLADVKGQGQQQANKQTVITNNELGKRGIVGSSTLAQQEIQNATDPIYAQIASNTKNIGLEKEQGLQALQNILGGLTSQETDAQRAVTNAIAQLQSGAGQAGIQQGLSMYQQQQAQKLQEQQAAAQKAQQDLENAQNAQLFPIQLKSAQADLQNKLNQNKLNSTIYNPFRINQTTNKPFTGNLSLGQNTADLIAQGKYQEALNLMQNP